MNVHDSGRIAGLLEEMGYSGIDNDSAADIIIFNTCTVREHARHKAISEVGRALQFKKRRKDLIVGVCGCVAQQDKEKLFKIYPELDIVFGPDQIGCLPELIGERNIIRTELVNDPGKYNWVARRDNVSSPCISEFVTIMKGCDNNCSFCIVPHVRGREVSRSADDIVAEVNALCARGVKEVLLLGQNVNSYIMSSRRLSSPDNDFVNLIRRISVETDILRLRYTSPHPKDLSDDLILEHSANPKLCRHMHLPLQSGSDAVLRAMKRSYNKKKYLERSSLLRQKVPGVEITTDIIVGFPGETDADFMDTLDVVREVQFDGMFAFKYSPRPGTKSAMMEDNVPKEVKEERLQRLLDLNTEIWKVKTSSLVGSVQDVLVEGTSKKHTGNSKNVIPTNKNVIPTEVGIQNIMKTLDSGLRRNDIQLTGRTFANKIVNFAGNLKLVGHIVPVRITSAGPNSLKGEIL
jgi:tRNA-2-methylthio-N6-dimethylallyladenosine synthase